MTPATAIKRELVRLLAAEMGDRATVCVVPPMRADIPVQESGSMVWAAIGTQIESTGELGVFGAGAPYRYDDTSTFEVIIQAACQVPDGAQDAIAAADASMAEADDLADEVLLKLLAILASSPDLQVSTGGEGVPGIVVRDAVPTRVLRQGGRLGDSDMCAVAMVVEIEVVSMVYSEEIAA